MTPWRGLRIEISVGKLIKREIKLAEREFVSNQIKKDLGNSNNIWKTIRLCIPKKSSSERTFSQDEKIAAENFNNSFVSVGNSTVDKINDLANDFGFECNRDRFKKLTALVLLDMSKAFDCVNHNLLMLKLQDMGGSQSCLQWFSSYLSNRHQVVRINSIVSDALPLANGVRREVFSALYCLASMLMTSQLHLNTVTHIAM